MGNAEEKRRYERVDTSLNVSFTAYDKTGSVFLDGEAVAVNMSKTGMLLQTGMAIFKDSLVDIIFQIDGNYVNLKCQCMYNRYADAGRYESGIHVKRINRKDISTYLGFVEKLEKNPEKTKNLRPYLESMTNVIKRISAEHKIINEYVAVLSELMHSESPKADYTETILQLMKKDVMTHFNIEENLFFKIGLSVMPEHCDEMIRILTEEHEAFIKTIDDLIEALQPRIINSLPVENPEKETILRFIEEVKQHAVVELRDLFPLLEGNAEAKRRIIEKVMKITKK